MSGLQAAAICLQGGSDLVAAVWIVKSRVRAATARRVRRQASARPARPLCEAVAACKCSTFLLPVCYNPGGTMLQAEPTWWR